MSHTTKKKNKSAIHSVGPFILGKTLGKGATGRVRLGFHKDTGFKVAVKIIHKAKIMQRDSMIRKKIEREVAVMKLIDNQNVLKLFDVYQTSDYLFLILELCPGGELFDYLVRKGSLHPPAALVFFQQIIDGIHHCHRHNVCHRDLKPENLLLDDDKNIKICDFGMGCLMQEGTLLVTSCGSPHYASPEVVQGLPYDGKKSDVWSCGVILFALLTGKLPFDDDNIHELLAQVKLGEFTIPPYLPLPIKDLIKGMLTVNPKDRLNTAQIRKHPWFRSNDPALPPSPPSIVKRKSNVLSADSDIDEDLIRNLESLGCGNEEEIRKQLRSNAGNMTLNLYRVLELRKNNPEFDLLIQAGDSKARRGRSASVGKLQNSAKKSDPILVHLPHTGALPPNARVSPPGSRKAKDENEKEAEDKKIPVLTNKKPPSSPRAKELQQRRPRSSSDVSRSSFDRSPKLKKKRSSNGSTSPTSSSGSPKKKRSQDLGSSPKKVPKEIDFRSPGKTRKKPQKKSSFSDLTSKSDELKIPIKSQPLFQSPVASPQGYHSSSNLLDSFDAFHLDSGSPLVGSAPQRTAFFGDFEENDESNGFKVESYPTTRTLVKRLKASLDDLDVQLEGEDDTTFLVTSNRGAVGCHFVIEICLRDSSVHFVNFVFKYGDFDQFKHLCNEIEAGITV